MDAGEHLRVHGGALGFRLDHAGRERLSRLLENPDDIERRAGGGAGEDELQEVLARIGALDAANVDVSVSGSGDVVIGGKADAVSTSIAGSGDVKAGKLAVRQAKVSIAGSGDATLWAKDSLDVKIVGSGTRGRIASSTFSPPRIPRSQ